MAKYDAEQIGTTDGVMWEVRRFHHDTTDGHCVATAPEHPIAPGEGYIETAQWWWEDGGKKYSTYQYCLRHGDEQVVKIRARAKSQ